MFSLVFFATLVSETGSKGSQFLFVHRSLRPASPTLERFDFGIDGGD